MVIQPSEYGYMHGVTSAVWHYAGLQLESRRETREAEWKERKRRRSNRTRDLVILGLLVETREIPRYLL